MRSLLVLISLSLLSSAAQAQNCPCLNLGAPRVLQYGNVMFIETTEYSQPMFYSTPAYFNSSPQSYYAPRQSYYYQPQAFYAPPVTYSTTQAFSGACANGRCGIQSYSSQFRYSARSRATGTFCPTCPR